MLRNRFGSCSTVVITPMADKSGPHAKTEDMANSKVSKVVKKFLINLRE